MTAPVRGLAGRLGLDERAQLFGRARAKEDPSGQQYPHPLGEANATIIGIVILASVSCAGLKTLQDYDEPCAFGPAENLGPGVNGPFFEGSPPSGPDERTPLFTSSRKERSTGPFRVDSSADGKAWGESVNLGPPVDDPPAGDFALRLSLNEQTLYFSSNRQGGIGSSDVYVARRKSTNQTWDPPENLGPLTTLRRTRHFQPRLGHRATIRRNRHEPPEAAQRLAEPINGPCAEFSPWIAPGGLTLYFASNRPGNIGIVDIWVTPNGHERFVGSDRKPWRKRQHPVSMDPWAIHCRQPTQALLHVDPARRAWRPDCGFFNCFDLYVTTLRCSGQSNEHRP
jgi:WD40-like Beta Propeller Repeat